MDRSWLGMRKTGGYRSTATHFVSRSVTQSCVTVVKCLQVFIRRLRPVLTDFVVTILFNRAYHHDPLLAVRCSTDSADRERRTDMNEWKNCGN